MYLFEEELGLPQDCTHVSWVPLSLHSLFLTSSYLNLHFGTQGRLLRLETLPYKQETGTKEAFGVQGAPQHPAWFQ